MQLPSNIPISTFKYEHKWRKCPRCGSRLVLECIVSTYDLINRETRRYVCKNSNCNIHSLEINCEIKPFINTIAGN